MKIAFSALSTITLWSSAFVRVRYSIPHYDPFEFSFLRLLFASTTLGLIALHSGFIKVKLKHLSLMALSGFFGATLYFTFLNLSMVSIGAAEASTLINTIPLFTALLSWAILKEKLKVSVWIGLCVSLLGVFILSSPTPFQTFEFSTGSFWVLLAAISMAACTLIQKGLLQHYPPTWVTFYASFSGTLFALPMRWKGLLQFPQTHWEINLTLIYLGVFPAGIAYLLWAHILKCVQASKAVTLLYATPIVTAWMAYFFLEEAITAQMGLGALLILLGVFMAQNKVRSLNIRKKKISLP